MADTYEFKPDGLHPLDAPLVLQPQDIFDIGDCATAIMDVFKVDRFRALDAAIDIKAEELGRKLDPLKELV